VELPHFYPTCVCRDLGIQKIYRLFLKVEIQLTENFNLHNMAMQLEEVIKIRTHISVHIFI